MAEIDILEFQKEQKRNRLKRLLKDKKALISLAILGASISGVCLNANNSATAIFAFNIGFEAQLLSRYWKRLGIPEAVELLEKLKSTETFKICYEEYDKYVTDVASLIKRLNFESAKETLSYLYTLLTSGEFSSYHQHQYELYAYEKIEIMEICGAKVLTGRSVCRHQASFFVDILSKLGYTTSVMTAMPTQKDPIKLAKKPGKIWSHAVVSIAENDQMYLYDPTCGRFCAKPTDIPFTEVESMLISQYVDLEPKFLVMNPKSSIMNVNHETQLKKINTLPQMSISTGEADYLNNRAEKIYRGNMHSQFEFFKMQEERRAKIAEMYRELCPYSDKPIKKWLIRK